MTLAELEATDPEAAAIVRKNIERLRAIVREQRSYLEDPEENIRGGRPDVD